MHAGPPLPTDVDPEDLFRICELWRAAGLLHPCDEGAHRAEGLPLPSPKS